MKCASEHIAAPARVLLTMLSQDKQADRSWQEANAAFAGLQQERCAAQPTVNWLSKGMQAMLAADSRAAAQG